MSRGDAVVRLAEVFERIRLDPLMTADGRLVTTTLSGGVAEYPADGATVDDVVWHADDAAAAAVMSGGNQVLRSDRDVAADPGVVDVVLVEDDEQLAELLGHALTTRGLSHEWLCDGVEAMEMLVGDSQRPPQLRPRVVLLDVNLPGMTGMAVLRRMADTDALSRTKVVMLTARSAEEEVVAALSLGAVDHVAKPFSVPVLMERLRHHLQP